MRPGTKVDDQALIEKAILAQMHDYDPGEVPLTVLTRAVTRRDAVLDEAGFRNRVTRLRRDGRRRLSISQFDRVATFVGAGELDGVEADIRR